MKNLIALFSLIVFLSSCACFEFSEPEMRGEEKFNVDKVNGKEINLSVSAKVYNPNCFGLKVKPSNLDLYVDGEQIGTVRLNKKVKMKSKRESDLNADLTATLTEGAMMKLLAYASKPEIKVQLKGKAKGGVFIFSKKFEIDETRTISGSSFKVGL